MRQSNGSLKTYLQHILDGPSEDLELAKAEIISVLNIRKQRQNLKAFVEQFASNVEPQFQMSQDLLLAKFVELLNNLRVLESESAFESTSSELGSVKMEIPGLSEGVTVSCSRDTFTVDEGRSLHERNEIRIKIGGLDAYTGYWLASDSPATNSKDAWQEEGLDTLRRILLSASLPLSDPIVPDAFQYPFIAALLSPFGPSAILPFEEHLSASHIYYSHEAGGSWFKVPSANNLNKARGQSSEYWSLKEKPKGALSTFEEAELELEKLDL